MRSQLVAVLVGRAQATDLLNQTKGTAAGGTTLSASGGRSPSALADLTPSPQRAIGETNLRPAKASWIASRRSETIRRLIT